MNEVIVLDVSKYHKALIFSVRSQEGMLLLMLLDPELESIAIFRNVGITITTRRNIAEDLETAFNLSCEMERLSLVGSK